MDFEKYATTVPYPSRNIQRTDPERYSAELKAYRENEARRYAEFKADLLEELGVTGHPKADKLFRLAWEMGHSGGFGDVTSYAHDMVELIKD